MDSDQLTSDTDRRSGSTLFKKKEGRVKYLYNTPHYNTDLDITLSFCGSQFFFNCGIFLRKL